MFHSAIRPFFSERLIGLFGHNPEKIAIENARIKIKICLKTRSKVHHRSETIDIMSIASFFY